MKYENNCVKDIKIAYIGGGSRGWAWGLMSDLVSCDDISGRVDLYDIDFQAAQNNEIIGNKFNLAEGAKSHWDYKAVKTIGEALTGANFVVVSILPGTFDEMESDVHAPEKYGIYQSVGDTVGPGGVIRALRTIPMMEEIALAVKEYSPDAWVINYTNPMALCVDALYKTFPQIKAFGCCHEVFGTKDFIIKVIDKMLGIKDARRDDIKVNVTGVNHFTWLTEVKYKNIDLFPVYREYCETHFTDGLSEESSDQNWMNKQFRTAEMVKMDLFKRFGYIAAAGDRHLAEFCEANWYLKDPEMVDKWGFGLTKVEWRKLDLSNRLKKSEELISGKQEIKIDVTGEEGAKQIRALLGLHDLVTNVNLPNRGQIPNLPMGTVVETNAAFRSDSVVPVFSGPLPDEIYPLISRVVGEQIAVSDAAKNRDLDAAFRAFICDLNVNISLEDAKALFNEMIKNTSKYLTMYNI